MGVLHYDFKGMLYDEWELDKAYITPARTIRESDVTGYCALSGDYNPMYTNEMYASKTTYKNPDALGGWKLYWTTGSADELLKTGIRGRYDLSHDDSDCKAFIKKTRTWNYNIPYFCL